MENLTILLVDDDPIINFIHRTIIASVFPNSRTVAVENGRLALDYIENHPEGTYLVFLDINMPVLDGWGFLDAVRTRSGRYDLSIHILTSSVDSRDIERSANDELVISYMTKPLTRGALLSLRSRM
ncbi:response regulator [Sphingobacterium sp. BS-2]|uniref:response regulator n=1 Tax=Sphingobacterium sp. BS-2 TaxID=3377129 RepID=UPI0038FD2E0D